MLGTRRLVRWLLTLSFFAGLGWLAWQSVSVRWTAETIEITLDKQQFRAASRVAARQGRAAVDGAGHLLRTTGDALENFDDSGAAATGSQNVK